MDDFILTVLVASGGVLFLVILSSLLEKGKRKKLNIPPTARKINYFKGYDKIIGGPNGKLYYWCENCTLYFCDTDDDSGPARITIPKENIMAFAILGDKSSTVSVSGGGVSLGGAAIGGILLGPVGAIIGGREKVKSQTITTDSRKTVLKFLEEKKEKSMLLEYSIYEDLCLLCTEKI